MVLQLGPQDECIVVGDTCEEELPEVEALVRSFGQNFRYLAHDTGMHDFGHSQLNYGIENARGDYVHCNDDDDIWADDALASMRRAARQYPGQPFLFRFISRHHGSIYWDRYGMLAQDHIGGHCLVAPNLPGKLGLWSSRYQGDFDYILDTVTRQGGIDSVIWRDEIIALARPNADHRQLVLSLAGRGALVG